MAGPTSSGPPPRSPMPPGPGRPVDFTDFPDLLAPMRQWFRELGDFVRYETRDGGEGYVLAAPDLAAHVLRDHAHSYTRGDGVERVKLLVPGGLLVVGDADWQRHRTMLQPLFQRRVLKSLADVFHRNARALRDAWLAAARAGTAVDVTTGTSEFALRSLLEALFGEPVGDGDPFLALARDHARDLAFAKRFRALRPHCAVRIEQALAAGRDTALVSLLAAARDGGGVPFTPEERIDEVMTFLVAGHETTATALTWTLLLLAEHAEAAAGLHRELDAATARGAPDAELLELPALRCVLDEALRLHPPVWLVSRRALAPDVLRGHTIVPGAQVFVPIWLLHRHPGWWAEPDRFLPQRFAADPSLRHAPAYLPFGLGPRHCIGGQFALLDMRCLLAHVAAAVELHRVDDAPIAPEPQINLRPRGPIVMQARVRGGGAARTRS